MPDAFNILSDLLNGFLFCALMSSFKKCHEHCSRLPDGFVTLAGGICRYILCVYACCFFCHVFPKGCLFKAHGISINKLEPGCLSLFIHKTFRCEELTLQSILFETVNRLSNKLRRFPMFVLGDNVSSDAADLRKISPQLLFKLNQCFTVKYNIN